MIAQATHSEAHQMLHDTHWPRHWFLLDVKRKMGCRSSFQNPACRYNKATKRIKLKPSVIAEESQKTPKKQQTKPPKNLDMLDSSSGWCWVPDATSLFSLIV